MVSQNKIFSFKIKRQAKNAFPSDVNSTAEQNKKKKKKKKNQQITFWNIHRFRGCEFQFLVKKKYADLNKNIYFNFIGDN